MTRIVLVDDDPLFRRMLADTLEDLGHEVRQAENGTQGLAAVRADPPDVVITDIIMPDTEGIETIFHLRRQHPQVKVIAISGGGRITAEDHLHAAKLMGAGRVLAKPFSAAEIESAIRELVAGKSP
jgi:CheY-like chemotaxis protein